MVIADKKGVQHLQSEVLSANACTSCGMCVGFCPYIKASRDRVTIIHECGLSEGRCYQVCPRGDTDLLALDTMVFGAPRSDHILGHHSAVLMGRSLLPAVRQRAQYGGVVSTLALLARETAMIDALIVTGAKDGPVPEGTVAWSDEDILACAGSKYAASPSMAALNRALAMTEASLGAVGRPCQVTAIRKLQALADEKAGQRVKLTI